MQLKVKPDQSVIPQDTVTVNAVSFIYEALGAHESAETESTVSIAQVKGLKNLAKCLKDYRTLAQFAYRNEMRESHPWDDTVYNITLQTEPDGSVDINKFLDALANKLSREIDSELSFCGRLARRVRDNDMSFSDMNMFN